MTFLDLKTIKVDYRRYAHNVSARRVARLRRDIVILSDRALAFPHQLFEAFPFVRAQFSNIALLAHLRLRRFESRQKRIIRSIQFS
jgi:hypothetical protein